MYGHLLDYIPIAVLQRWISQKGAWGRAILASILVTVFALNPAHSEVTFAPFMSRAEESRIGAEEHPKILARFGGVYKDRGVSGYVAEVGGRLIHHAQLSEQRFIFTVLNTPDVNAFALPGGYVYVTRGLLALANSEAELAGVLAHEIGHVVARHSAERYSRAILTRLGGVLLNTLTKSEQLDNFLRLGSDIYLSSFSREQEYEADLLGIDYLRRVGYDPGAQADFLANLGRYTELQAQISGDENEISEPFNLLSTHPRTADRIQRAIDEVAGIKLGSNGLRRRVDYLHNINGMLYGDDPSHGFVRSQTFSHPTLGFTFNVPPRFRLINLPKKVVAAGPRGTRIVFDSALIKNFRDPLRYLTTDWMRGFNLYRIERININGLDAATARAYLKRRDSFVDVRCIAIRFDANTIYRMLFVSTPSNTSDLEMDFRRTTYSFRRLSAEESSLLKPFRIRLAAVRVGDTLDSLLSRMPSQVYAKDWFLVLNGITAKTPLEVGRLIKYVGD